MMNIEKKLDVWTKEKLITGAQKKAVLEYEERLKSRSLLYTLLFLGGFCFGLGIISLIAYNWQDISPAAKLVIYFVMLAATGAIRHEVFDTIHIARKLCEVLAQQYPELLKTRYRLDTVVCDGTELFNSVAKKRGFLVSGGEIDEERCAACLLDEFRAGKIGRITLEKA